MATGFALLLNHFHLKCPAQMGYVPWLRLQGTAVLHEKITGVIFLSNLLVPKPALAPRHKGT